MVVKSVRLQQASHRLKSKSFRHYLDDPVFAFANGLKYSRSGIAMLDRDAALCVRAMFALFRAFDQYGIDSPAKLYSIGLDGLLRCRKVGERAAWIAAVLLDDSGYSVRAWCDMKRRKTLTVKGSIRLVHNRTRKQKHG